MVFYDGKFIGGFDETYKHVNEIICFDENANF